MTGEEAKEPAVADPNPFLSQPCTQIRNRQIRLPMQHLQDPLAMRFDHMATTVSSHRKRRQSAAVAIAPGNLAHGTRRYLETSRDRARRTPRFDRRNDP